MIRCTDKQLLDQLNALRDRERTTTLDILIYLAEVERRKLHLSLGYSSMFAFATCHLHYSESAAGRRVQAARCVRDHPELAKLLRRGSINLSTLSLVARILNDANKKDLLAQIGGKSQRDVETIVAMYKPATRVRDRIQPVCVPVAKPIDSARNGPTGAPAECAAGALFGSNHSRSWSDSLSRKTNNNNWIRPYVEESNGETRVGTSGETHGEDLGRIQIETRFKVQFAARPAFMQKFEEVRALLTGRFPRGPSFETVFEAALDAFLERQSPIQRDARRKQSAAKANGPTNVNGRAEAGTKWRGIPVAVRDAVYVRDGGRCTFVGTAQQRCDSTHDVEIDHRQPVARGGTNDIENLRLLCSTHNRSEAERVFGVAWMQQFQ